ncbi:hypothetical protein PR202_ga24810 [Eleusine coracana subsp. coracana]|uniref:Glycosyltransferase n=1 Tax=Eleusine coracana subsp. coracana TaxID=191504 RepID=A0AAV5D8X2_ELECO|nr:hypothetical protein QOZ80_9AG0674290 [Eleusine coracana subsp. coracana]GJN07022.1 hypothetical protein PR202_ga24810 [Eleusine coracana subsp. coracana]
MADDGSGSREGHHHFLIVVYGIQSHINPARALAHRLTRLGVAGSIRATLCLSVSSHRRMFPSSNGADETTDGVISYTPYCDGLDDNSLPNTDDEERARNRRVGFESLSSVIGSLAARGLPVTRVMCTMVLPAVLDVSLELGIPLVVYWIQPAHVLTAYYYYFHGYGDLIASHVATDPAHEVSLPGLTRPIRVGDLPSFLVDTSGSELTRIFKETMRELFEFVDRQRPKLLVNTFDGLEPAVLADMKRHLDVFVVGPMVGSSTEARVHLFKHDDVDRKRYMDWLDAQPEESVVYVSFGSISKYKKQQMEEIVEGLKQCGRPYLLVVRKDGLEDDMMGYVLESAQDQGVVVEWCNQLEVLSHAAVGCFVTHCGWNSTLEAVASGVPIIGVPNMFVDQPINAYLVEEEWLIGTKVELNSEGILTRKELARCIELIMGEGAKANDIRERTKALKLLAQEAAVVGGHAERNLLHFVKTI